MNSLVLELFRRQQHGAVVADCELGQTDRQIPRHESCRHDYSVVPSAAPWKKSNTSQSTQASLDGPPASAELLPALSKYHIPTCTHINIQTLTQGIFSLGVQLEQIQRMSYHTTITHQGYALLVRLHHPEPWPPPTPPVSPTHLHVIRFQEHWAHKPGHVLLCSVCQNNSAVSNTVRL